MTFHQLMILLQHFHESVRKMSAKYEKETKRWTKVISIPFPPILEISAPIFFDFIASISRCNYVTPTSYLELILTFKSLLKGKRDDILNLKTRYEMGLGKLEFASSQANIIITIDSISNRRTFSGDRDAKRADSLETSTAWDQRWDGEADDQDRTRHHSGDDGDDDNGDGGNEIFLQFF